MPYIAQDQRTQIDAGLKQLPIIDHPGKLNYTLTEVCIKYLLDNQINYQTINDIKGALDEVAAEFRERCVKPYEKMKRRLCGDISYTEVDKILLDLGCEVNPYG